MRLAKQFYGYIACVAHTLWNRIGGDCCRCDSMSNRGRSRNARAGSGSDSGSGRRGRGGRVRSRGGS